MCGILMWTYFSQSAGHIAGTLTGNTHIFSKVYFPRLIMPLSQLISNVFAFAIQFVVFAMLWLYFKHKGAPLELNLQSLLIFPLVLQCAALALGFGLIIAALTAKYRDLMHALTFLLQLWMYATPVIYPLSQVPERWRWIVQLNPMAPVIEGTKAALLGSGTGGISGFAFSIVTTGIVLVSGLVFFHHAERNFVDTV